jgi:beta-hydroxyacyl-ACP dehydratase FabZ
MGPNRFEGMVAGTDHPLFCLIGTPPVHEQQWSADNFMKKIQDIFKILPHRYPFLLVDKVLESDGATRMVAVKNVTINEHFFEGHFPEHPVMPGVLVVEALAQVGVLLLFGADENRAGKLVYFSGIDNCRFRQPVVPGDQIRLEVTVLRQRGHYYKMRGEAFVEGTLVAEAVLSCTVVDRV